MTTEGWTAHFEGAEKAVVIECKKHARRFLKRSGGEGGFGDPPVVWQQDKSITFPGWDRPQVEAALEFAYERMGPTFRRTRSSIRVVTTDELRQQPPEDDEGEVLEDPALRDEVDRLTRELDSVRRELWKVKEDSVPRVRAQTAEEWANENTSLGDLAEWIHTTTRTLGFGDNPGTVLDRVAETTRHAGYSLRQIWEAILRRENVAIEGDLPTDDMALKSRVLELEREFNGGDPAPDLDKDEALLREMDGIIGETSTLPVVVQEHLRDTINHGELVERVRAGKAGHEVWSRGRTLTTAYRTALTKAEASYRTLQRVDQEYPGGILALYLDANPVTLEVGSIVFAAPADQQEADVLRALSAKLEKARVGDDGRIRRVYDVAEGMRDYLGLVRIKSIIRINVGSAKA